jgi:hypothetical protein
MWKANGKTTTLQLFLDSLSPKTEKLSLEETMDLSRDRLIPPPPPQNILKLAALIVCLGKAVVWVSGFRVRERQLCVCVCMCMNARTHAYTKHHF